MAVHPGSGALETVGVIMPTLALRQRADALRAAITSAVSQSGVRAIPLLVVNGSAHDPALVEELSARTDLRLTKLARADLPGALAAGREMVDTPWFCELDDDDLLLPGTLAALLARMDAKPACDVVVSNGIVRSHTGDRPLLTRITELAADPLSALAHQTWLSPGGALFRSSAVPARMFANLARYLEWTSLALRLARECRIAFVDRAGFVHHTDLPDSLWRSPNCVLGLPAAIRSLLAEELPPDLRRSLGQRLGAACHAAALRGTARAGSTAPRGAGTCDH